MLTDIPKWTEILQTVAATIQALVVVVAAIYAYRQVGEAKSSRMTTAAIYLAKQVNNQDSALRRRRLFWHIAERIHDPNEEEKLILGVIANEYHSLGYLVKRDILDSETVMGLQAIAVVRAWNAMEPWIIAERAKRPNYADHFEDLKNMATEYCRKNGIND